MYIKVSKYVHMAQNNIYKMNNYLLYPPQEIENSHYLKGYPEINTRQSFVNKIIIIIIYLYLLLESKQFWPVPWRETLSLSSQLVCSTALLTVWNIRPFEQRPKQDVQQHEILMESNLVGFGVVCFRDG